METREIPRLDGSIVIGRLKKDEIVNFDAVTNDEPAVFSGPVICSDNEGWETKDLQAHAEPRGASEELHLLVRASQMFADRISKYGGLLERICRELVIEANGRQFALLPQGQLTLWFTRRIADITVVGTFKLVGTEPKLIIQFNAPLASTGTGNIGVTNRLPGGQRCSRKN